MAKKNTKAKNVRKKEVININRERVIKSESINVPVYDPNEAIFALDIGTRTVVGIVGVVGVQDQDRLNVIAVDVIEHKDRAMLDGQIHDINKVAEVVRRVKENLESRIGIKLEKVAIAAAGRVLKTSRVYCERSVEQTEELTSEIVGRLELAAIHKAQLKLDDELNEEDKVQFYCVGHSVVNYFLNGFIISSLLGHKAKKIGVDLLATFLPKIVVESLYTVMNKIGLEVVNLTLEPIAAMSVAIPKDLRILNLALVDIGAGTSDIAITKDGSVFAYAMVPVAGDELSEKLTEHYLVDFNTAEKIKISLSEKIETISFEDILGINQNIKVSEILEVLNPLIEQLAMTIAAKILEYNRKAPNAVFLIGGGSQIPGLTEFISNYIQLPKERVVVKDIKVIKNINYTGKILNGPEGITPFGIAVSSLIRERGDFLNVTVNGTRVRLFNSKQLVVADALILIGFNPNELIGRSGKSINFELNGVKKVKKGEYGKAAEIFVNDELGSLDTIIRSDDTIKIIPAEDGKNAELKVSDYVKNMRVGKILLNNEKFDIDTKIYINGKIAGVDSKIEEGDIVHIHEIDSVEELLRSNEMNYENVDIYVNDKLVNASYELKDLDNVSCKNINMNLQTLKSEIEKIKVFNYNIDSIKNISDEDYEKQNYNIMEEIEMENTNNFDKKYETELIITVNGEKKTIKSDKSRHIFVDIFNYIDFDVSKPQGNIVLKLNGKQAGFTDALKSGDEIDIYWENTKM